MEPFNRVKVLLLVLLARQQVNAFSMVSELTAKHISWSFTYGLRSTESFNFDIDVGASIWRVRAYGGKYETCLLISYFA